MRGPLCDVPGNSPEGSKKNALGQGTKLPKLSDSLHAFVVYRESSLTLVLEALFTALRWKLEFSCVVHENVQAAKLLWQMVAARRPRSRLPAAGR